MTRLPRLRQSGLYILVNYGHRFSLVNIDATIIAQEPQLAGYLGQIRRSLGEVLRASAQHINVKATSPEGIGALGTGEGIAAIAIVTMKGPE